MSDKPVTMLYRAVFKLCLEVGKRTRAHPNSTLYIDPRSAVGDALLDVVERLGEERPSVNHSGLLRGKKPDGLDDFGKAVTTIFTELEEDR